MKESLLNVLDVQKKMCIHLTKSNSNFSTVDSENITSAMSSLVSSYIVDELLVVNYDGGPARQYHLLRAAGSK